MIIESIGDTKRISGKTMTNKIIEEGTWFAVPLRSHGFVAGVAARTSSGGRVILAYFFSAVWSNPPLLSDVKTLTPKSAVRVLRVGDLGLVDGNWIILGRDPGWRRDDWEMPQFERRDDVSRRSWIVQYSDHDASIIESETPAAYKTELGRDSVFGAGAAEIELTELVNRMRS